MIQNILNDCCDPVIQKMIWSGSAFILIWLLVIVIKRIFYSQKLNEEKRQIYRRWTNVVGLTVGFFILLRIWLYRSLVELFNQLVYENVFIPGIGLILFLFIVYVIRRLIASQKIEVEKRHFYMKWATYVFILLSVFILFRIWVYSHLSEFFKSGIIEKLFKSTFAFGVVYFILYFIRRFINSLDIEIQKRHHYRKRTTYIAALVYVVILIFIWSGNTQQWATVLSIMGAGIALALHEVLLNMAGWIYIIIRRPYVEGDRIELGNVKGDVIDIRLFQTSLLEIGNWIDGDQSTGRLVHLPHGQIFRNSLYNYTKGFEFIWNELSILVTFESNWEKAKEILLKCGEEESREIQEKVEKKIDRMAREYLIYYRSFTPMVYIKIEESGVRLTLRYLTNVKKRRDGENAISQRVLSVINASSDIDFAYPTYRMVKKRE